MGAQVVSLKTTELSRLERDFSRLVGENRAALRTAAEKAIAAGETLIRARRLLGLQHGQWLKWLRRQARKNGIALSTAQQWLRIAERCSGDSERRNRAIQMTIAQADQYLRPHREEHRILSATNQATTRILVGDVREKLREIADQSVHMVVTSPPYWGQRDYNTATWQGGDRRCQHKVGHRKASRIQPENSMTTGVAPGNDNWRCIKCGAKRIDQQIGIEKSPEDYIDTLTRVFREIKRVLRDDGTVWLNLGDTHHDKQLLMIPARVALALQADGWLLRSDIIWDKGNSTPESVRDRPVHAYDHIFLMTKKPSYYYDRDAVREQARYPGAVRGRTYLGKNAAERVLARNDDPDGHNLRNVWRIATEARGDGHHATFPTRIPRRCILAGTSAKGCCKVCGKPWVRGAGHWEPQCEHGGEPVPCTVLDPFGGVGTTAAVANALNRAAVLIELNQSYAEMARERLAKM